MPGSILDFFLDGGNVGTVTEAVSDPRLVPTELFWTGRTPVRPATDREMTAQWRGSPVIADLISLDAPSPVYKMLQMRYTTAEIPKLKYGTYLGESEMRDVLSLGQAQFAASGRVPEFVRRMLTTLFRQLEIGRLWRIEQLIVASILNSFSYDRLKIKVSAGWNKDPALITTLSPGIETTATSKPITAIRVMRDYAATMYGVNLNRLVLSRACFDGLTLTDEFKTEAQSFFVSLFTLTALPAGTREQKIDAFKRATQIEEVVFNDSHFRYQTDDGTRGLQRQVPINAMILEDTANDNNEDRRYIGNAGVTETAFIGRVGAREFGVAGPGDLTAMRDGPFYYTFVDHDLDPPTINARVVQHPWPILREPNNSAVIYAGTVTDAIPIVDTF